jgi:hypothetical protein
MAEDLNKEEGEFVMLGFEYGDPNRPFVAGSIFSEKASKFNGKMRFEEIWGEGWRKHLKRLHKEHKNSFQALSVKKKFKRDYNEVIP